jgi:hypothetical protein
VAAHYYEEEQKMNKSNTDNNNPHTPASLVPVIGALERTYDIFNRDIFDGDLSRIVIAISRRGAKNCSGWFSISKVWRDSNENYHEINICPESLYRPIEDICEILLHEMCHFYAAQKGIQDCSRSSQYHNKKFKMCAEQHGLLVEKHPSRGYATTSLKSETLEYIKSLDLTEFHLFREERRPIPTEKKSSSARKFVCPAPKCPLIAYIKKKACGGLMCTEHKVELIEEIR